MEENDPLITIVQNNHRQAKLDEVRRKSFERQEYERKKKQREKKIKQKVTAILVTLGICTSLGFGINAIVKEAKDPTTMYNLSPRVGYTVNVGNEDVWTGGVRSIVSQNTYRTIANGQNVAAFSHERMAQDLLDVDVELFDYAFATVCYDMSNDMNSQITGSSGKTQSNIDWVIEFMTFYAEHADSETAAYIKTVFKDVEGLDAFLTKYGWTNKDGEPDCGKFIKHEQARGSYINEYLESKGVPNGRN